MIITKVNTAKILWWNCAETGFSKGSNNPKDPYSMGIIVSPMIQANKQIIVKYTKKNNVLNSEIFDDVLFVPNLSGTQ